MCQNWYSVIGQLLDVTGFLLLAFEWHMMFTREIEERNARVQAGYDRSAAEAEGKKYKDPAASDYTMWRPFSKFISEDKKRRQAIFFTGVTLIVLGFLYQVAGSWPHLLPSRC
jgi:hypothetical protein